jgi:hypothetical protein
MKRCDLRQFQVVEYDEPYFRLGVVETVLGGRGHQNCRISARHIVLNAIVRGHFEDKDQLLNFECLETVDEHWNDKF